MHEAVAVGLGIGVVMAPELGTDNRVCAIPIWDRGVESAEFIACLEERRNAPFIAAFFEIAKSLGGP